jgi:hypothetical protein
MFGSSRSTPGGVFLSTPSFEIRWNGARTYVPVSMAYAGETISELGLLTLVHGSNGVRVSSCG